MEQGASSRKPVERFEIIWEAPDYEFREKSIGWYWISILVAVVLLGIAVWQKNFLFGLFVLIAEILIIVWANREPDFWRFTLNEKGLHVHDHKFYPFTSIGSFSVIEHPHSHWHEIHLHLTRSVLPSLRVHVPKEHSDDIQKVLATVIPFIEHEHSMVDSLGHFFRF